MTTKSLIIQNFEASPRVFTPPYLYGGTVRSAVETLEVAAADNDGKLFMFFPVWSHYRVERLLLWNDAITGGTAYHCGLVTPAGATVVASSDQLFATSVDCSSARVAPLDITFEALNIDRTRQRIWELLGLSRDPGAMYYLAMTGATVGTAAGTLTLCMQYQDNS